MSLFAGQLRRCTRAATAGVVVAVASCNGETAVRASTAPQLHVLRVQASGAGSGTVTAPDASPQIACSVTMGAVSGVCGTAYPSNSSVQLIATPNALSTFAGWSGACTGLDHCVVDMSQERAVTAAFAAK